MKSGLAISDLVTGMYTATAILAALEHRHVSGKGQYIDMSLLDCLVAITSNQANNYFFSGEIPRRMGNTHPNLVPYQVFRCREGDIIGAVGNDPQYEAFCQVLGRPDLATDPRYRQGSERTRNRDSLVPVIAGAMLGRSAQEWIAPLEAANVPCGPVYDMQQVFADPQIRHRNMQVSLPHSAGPAAPGVASPIRLSETPVRYGQAAPCLGEHSAAILGERLGLSAERIADLRARKII
jgi:crotonobetainyl-CoA:carnitine CoA-transferase CaiB-like acyl-CoA transferase